MLSYIGLLQHDRVLFVAARLALGLRRGAHRAVVVDDQLLKAFKRRALRFRKKWHRFSTFAGRFRKASTYSVVTPARDSESEHLPDKVLNLV